MSRQPVFDSGVYEKKQGTEQVQGDTSPGVSFQHQLPTLQALSASWVLIKLGGLFFHEFSLWIRLLTVMRTKYFLFVLNFTKKNTQATLSLTDTQKNVGMLIV